MRCEPASRRVNLFDATRLWHCPHDVRHDKDTPFPSSQSPLKSVLCREPRKKRKTRKGKTKLDRKIKEQKDKDGKDIYLLLSVLSVVY